MSHKQAKEERKMVNLDTLPPIQMQLVINFHQGGQVTAQFPTNIGLAMHMIAETLKMIGSKCEFKEPSPILQVPPGAKLVE